MNRRSGRRNLSTAGFLVIGLVLGANGCSDFVTPTGRYAMTHPWDVGGPIARGTSKAEIRAKWGDPDAVIPHGVDELGLAKEEWVYQAKADLPIDYRYLSKTKRILFTGDHVTGWEDEAAQDGPTHH